MPIKLKRIFEAEYGKKKGDRVFYGWEHKHNLGKEKLEHMKVKPTQLILKGNKPTINRMYSHLLKEHPSTRGHLFKK